MPRFSGESKLKLESLHPKLRFVLQEAIKHFDFTVLETHRNEEDQNIAFETGSSKLKFPDSKHNSMPSLAADIAPWPVDWENRERFYFLAGLVMGIARMYNITLRWGGNWSMSWDLRERQNFVDLPHFELILLE